MKKTTTYLVRVKPVVFKRVAYVKNSELKKEVAVAIVIDNAKGAVKEEGKNTSCVPPSTVGTATPNPEGEEGSQGPWRWAGVDMETILAEQERSESEVVVKTEPEDPEEGDEADQHETIDLEQEQEEPVKELTEEEKAKAALEAAVERELLRQRQHEYRIRKKQEEKEKMAKMSPEEREEYLKKKRERERHRKRKKQTNNWTEKQKFYSAIKLQLKLSQMTAEERRAWTARNTESARRWRHSLTGEKLKRFQEYQRKKASEYWEKRKLRSGNAGRLKEKQNENYRCQIAKQTPEQRQRRLRRYQIYQAMTKLRKQCEDQGVPEDEIERRLDELKTTMEAEPLPSLETLSSYKPRPRKRRESSKPRKPRAPRRIYFGNRRGRPRISESSNDNAAPTSQDEPESIQFDFKCSHCTSMYSLRDDLIAHVSAEHANRCFNCPECRAIVLSPAELQEHFKAEHIPPPPPPLAYLSDGKPILRVYSSAKAKAKKKLAESSKRIEGNTSISNSNTPPATASPVLTSQVESVDVEMNQLNSTSRASNGKFSCIKCTSERRFEEVEDFMEHFKSFHPASYWPCPKCQILKYTKRSLKVHEKLCNSSSLSSRKRRFFLLLKQKF